MVRRRQPNAAGDTVDKLTGLPDRQQLDTFLSAALEQARYPSERFVLLLITIDNLRDINEIYGPDHGDYVLRTIGGRLSKLMGPNADVARYEGAEFAVLCRRVSTIEAAQQICDHIFIALADPVTVGSDAVPVIGYIGGTLSHDRQLNPTTVVREARLAVTEAREDGPGGCFIRDFTSRSWLNFEVTPERIRKAFEEDEFRVVYQPIVSPSQGNMVGFEALLRWRWLDPTSGTKLIPASAFLSVLRRTSLAVPVSSWVAERACRQVKIWSNLTPGAPDYFVAVNLAASQLTDRAFVGSIVAAYEAAGLPPEHLVLDVTENALRHNRRVLWPKLRELKKRGVRLALDDFGTGYSTLSSIRELSLDLLRIPRSFVQGLGMSEEDTTIVRNVVRLAQELQIAPCAQGVEEAEQAQQLVEMDCPLAQGFYFGRPELAEQLERRLRARCAS
ncbi:MAG: putative signaling protein [Acidimicrobiales bacterium]|nr:MAG: bifunctional diguanylate cyclase/phosphodiesterase [Actinomycetota bacterium]MBV6508224.1 putative signaling protein [Acidimicrobiales bacterium]RIK07297.1 MAG: hypothetical protein DCC48_04245 [Acidobacteriota bacterium]